jgi:hypothetical protein
MSFLSLVFYLSFRREIRLSTLSYRLWVLSMVYLLWRVIYFLS